MATSLTDCDVSDISGTKFCRCLCEAPVTHLGTERPPRSDFSGLQRMVMTELRPWSHDAVACRDLWENSYRTFICWELIWPLSFVLYL